MKIKNILLIILIVLISTGCTKLEDMSYDDIINNVIVSKNNCNTFRRGYKLFIPKGLFLNKAGPNYAIISSNNNDYYLFVDLISYNSKKEINYTLNNDSIYSKLINYDGKKGYINIKNEGNNQYLIEIMYNYAKIEVMVDDNEIKNSLAYSMSILKSIIYDDKVIESLLKEDDLIYTEEIFDMFGKTKKKSGILNYTDENVEIKKENPIKDSDYVNWEGEN